MKKFLYKAWNKDFKIVKGVIYENDIKSAKLLLTSKDLILININSKNTFFKFFHYQTKLTYEELSNFCGQLSLILSSGLNIVNGLDILYNQTKNKRMKKIIDDISSKIKQGNTLSQSMNDTYYFPNLLIDIVHSGEINGNLDVAFLNLENLYEKQSFIKNKVKNASIYPLLLLCVSFGMLVFFNYFIFSELKTLFTNNKDLPLITKLLFFFMNIFDTYFLEIIFILFLLILLINYLKKLPKIKYFLDKIILSIPFVKDIKLSIISSRFTRSMGMFLKSGIPIIYALEKLKSTINNEYIARKMDFVKMDIINGLTISESMDNYKVFDPFIIQMIKLGEQTGKLEESLFKLADIYDKRSENSIAKLLNLIEPVFTLFIGILVAVIILAVALPIMQMTNKFN